MDKRELTLNNQQVLLCHKHQPTNQPAFDLFFIHFFIQPAFTCLPLVVIATC